MEDNFNDIIEELLNEITPLYQAQTDAKMSIAARIADAMKAKGWKKKDLLKAVGKTNQSVITAWLSGTQNFTVDTLVEIGMVLDINFLNINNNIIKFKVQDDKNQSDTFDLFSQITQLNNHEGRKYRSLA